MMRLPHLLLDETGACRHAQEMMAQSLSQRQSKGELKLVQQG